MSFSTSDMTIVIVSIVGGDAFERCQSAVRALGARFVAVDRDGLCVDDRGQVLNDTRSTNVPARRMQAAQCVDTPLIAFLEDTVAPGERWMSAACAALGTPGIAIVAGPVIVSPDLPARCRALGLTEYGRFDSRNFCRLAVTGRNGNSPLQVSAVPGANFALRTEELMAVLPASGLIEHEVVARLAEKGLGVAYEPDMQVTYKEAFDDGASLATRFDHGRIYASRALGNAGLPGRIASAMKAFVLPAVLTARTLADARRSGRFTVGAMGWVAVMNAAWSAGEFAGAVSGASRSGLDGWK